MLPVVRGEAATRRQILAYAVVLVAFTVLPFVDRPVRRRSTSVAARAPRRRLLVGSRLACCSSPSRPPRCASTSPRSPTWRCSSARWPLDRVISDENPRRGSQPGSGGTIGAGLLAAAIAIFVFGLTFVVAVFYIG